MSPALLIDPELDRMLRKTGPGKATEIVELYAVVAADIKATEAQWDAADSTAGLNTTSQGEVKLAGSAIITVEHAVGTDFITDLNNDSPFSVGKITWAGSQDTDFEIREITAFLHPKRTGAAKEVSEWQIQIFRLHRIYEATFETPSNLELMPLGPPIKVDAPGTVATNIVFDFTTNDRAPKPKLAKPIQGIGASSGFEQFISYVFISALKANGDPAGNVGWGSDSATPSKTTSGNTLEQVTLTKDILGEGTGRFDEVKVTDTPRMRLRHLTYTPATIVFSQVGNRINIGTTGNDHVCVAKGRQPGDTTIVYSIKGNLADALTEFLDGDLVGVDNTPTGGKDLSAVTKSAIYDTIQAALTDNSNSDTTPVLEELGVEEISTRRLHDRATVEVEWELDPFELRGLIAEAQIDVLRDGSRMDFQDEITQFLVDHDVVDIGFRLFVGHPDLDRNKWLHIDDFPFIRDYDPQEDRIRFSAISALAGLRKALPVATGSPVNRDTLVYTSQTLKFVYDDLVDGQAGLAARFRGPGISDAVTTISKTIGQKQGDGIVTSLSDVKRELDPVCFIAGGGLTTDRGKVRFTNVFDDDTIDVWFAEEEIEILSVSPGLSLRMPEVFLPWDYDVESRQFANERRGFHTNAINAVGVATLDTPTRLADIIGQWIDTVALAQSTVVRHLDAFAVGLRTWRFRSAYAYPELRIGRRAAIETRALVLRDPINSRQLRGHLWALGTVVGVHDGVGTEFTLWIRHLSDIIASEEIVNVEKRKVLSVRVFDSANQTIIQPPDTGVIDWNSEVFDVGTMHDNVTNNSRLTAPVAGKYMVQGIIKFSGAFHNTGGETIDVELKDGSGNLLALIAHWIQAVDLASGQWPFTAVVDLAATEFVFIQITFGPASPGAGGITIVQGSDQQSAFEMSYIGA